MSEQSSILSPSIKKDPISDSVLNPKPQDSFLFSPPLSIPPSSTPIRLNKATTLSTSTPLHLKNIPTPTSTSPIEIDISPAHDHTHNSRNPTKNNGRGSTGSPVLFGSEASCSPIKGNTKLIDASEQPLANKESCDYHMDGDLITIIESPVEMAKSITPPTTEGFIKSNTDHLVNHDKENTLTEGDIHSNDLCRNEMLIKPSTMKDEAPPMLSNSQQTSKALGTPNEPDTPTKMTTIPNTGTKAPPTINESTTTPKPLLRRSTRKRNARMAANSMKKKQLKDEESYEEEEEDSDFMSNIRKTGRKNLKQKSKVINNVIQDKSCIDFVYVCCQRQQAATTSSTSISSDCECGPLLTEEMKSEIYFSCKHQMNVLYKLIFHSLIDSAVCLSSLFPNRDDLTNSLLYHTLDIHDIEDQNMVCIPRESQVMNHIEKMNTKG